MPSITTRKVEMLRLWCWGVLELKKFLIFHG